MAHPTYIKVPDDVDSIKIPISWSVGEEDLQMKGPDVMRMKTMLESKKDAEHDVQVIPGAKHGFAIRTHPAERAEEQAVSWFSRCFSQEYTIYTPTLVDGKLVAKFGCSFSPNHTQRCH